MPPGYESRNIHIVNARNNGFDMRSIVQTLDMMFETEKADYDSKREVFDCSVLIEGVDMDAFLYGISSCTDIETAIDSVRDSIMRCIRTANGYRPPQSGRPTFARIR